MKVCDVVCNSIWYDPRVRKQIVEYQNQGVEVVAVGLRDHRYDKERIDLIPCRTNVVCIDERYEGKQQGLFRKLWREHLRNAGLKAAVLAERPDVIHANDLDALLAVYPAYKKLHCRLIYDSHEICIENPGTVSRYKFLLPFLKRWERHMIKHLDQMVCVSHAAARYFADTYHVEEPLVITNCSLASEAVTGAEKKTGFEVLNHGQFYAGRGYDIMVEAAPLLKEYTDVKLALRGFGVMEGALRARVTELQADNVIFYPRVRVEELIPQAAASMVGLALTQPICLNYKLSVSNKLFEYASAGLPVIMSDIPEHRYLNEKYEFGLILPEDTPEQLAKAIVQLYTDTELYETCRKNALVMSHEVNWETEFGRLIQLERKLVRDDFEKKAK